MLQASQQLSTVLTQLQPKRPYKTSESQQNEAFEGSEQSLPSSESPLPGHPLPFKWSSSSTEANICNTVMNIIWSLKESPITLALWVPVLSLSASIIKKTHFCVDNASVIIGISSMQEGGLLRQRGNFICDKANFIQSPGHLLDTDVSRFMWLVSGPSLMTSLLLEALFPTLLQLN